jgi:hypothetical protein
MKFFNTEGPINPEKHYYLADRSDKTEIYDLIKRERYFILHAPSQTGKTTEIRSIVKEMNKEAKYKALYLNVEVAQAARNNVIEGLLSILRQFNIMIKQQLGKNDVALGYLQNVSTIDTVNMSSLSEFLHFWAEKSKKPLVLFIDEIDSLIGDTLISVLRQLRSGYPDRPEHFPQSLCLVGVRDVRDYRIWSKEKQAIVLGGSAFNIKAEALRLADFSHEDVKNLYEQHTQETGQKFAEEAIEYAFYLTQGQPWLVNAIAYQACFRDIKDRSAASQ